VDIALCYTFNGFDTYRKQPIASGSEMSEEEWSIDDGYKTPGTLDMYPRRATEAGPQFGFSAMLQMSKLDFDYKCSLNPGFYVSLLENLPMRLKIQIILHRLNIACLTTPQTQEPRNFQLAWDPLSRSS
jgi:hypothetical protein